MAATKYDISGNRFYKSIFGEIDKPIDRQVADVTRSLVSNGNPAVDQIFLEELKRFNEYLYSESLKLEKDLKALEALDKGAKFFKIDGELIAISPEGDITLYTSKLVKVKAPAEDKVEKAADDSLIVSMHGSVIVKDPSSAPAFDINDLADAYQSLRGVYGVLNKALWDAGSQNLAARQKLKKLGSGTVVIDNYIKELDVCDQSIVGDCARLSDLAPRFQKLKPDLDLSAAAAFNAAGTPAPASDSPFTLPKEVQDAIAALEPTAKTRPARMRL